MWTRVADVEGARRTLEVCGWTSLACCVGFVAALRARSKSRRVWAALALLYAMSLWADWRLGHF